MVYPLVFSALHLLCPGNSQSTSKLCAQKPDNCLLPAVQSLGSGYCWPVLAQDCPGNKPRQVLEMGNFQAGNLEVLLSQTKI